MREAVVSFADVWEMYEVKFIKNKKVSWEKIWALQGVSFEIFRGECVCIIGENGSGKSTTLKLISGMLKPDKGSVKINGTVSALLELGAGFHPELTGRDNVYLNASLFGLPKNTIDKVFEEIVAFSGLGRFIDATVRCYSQGMFVRLAFALAIHVNPDIILVDDTLAVGDEEFQKKCIKKIFELKESGKTIILVTHDLNIAERLCARGMILRDGRLLQHGPLQRIIPSYLETVGLKEGLGILQYEHLRVVFNNGRIFLNWKGVSLTKHLGGYISCFIKDRNYLSSELHWHIGHIDGRSITAQGRHPYLDLEYTWKIVVFEDYSFKVEIDRAVSSDAIEVKDETFNLMLTDEYKNWSSMKGIGAFNEHFAHEVNWEQAAPKIAQGDIMAVMPISGTIEHLPGIVFDGSRADPAFRITGHNTGCNVSARAFRAVLSEAALGLSLSRGGRFFDGYFRLFYDEKAINDFIEKKRRERTFTAGDIRLLVDYGKIGIFFRDCEVTQDAGLLSSFLSLGRWLDSTQAHWTIQRKPNGFTVKVQWQDIPITQLWHLEIIKENEIRWRVQLEVHDKVVVQEEKAGIALSAQYVSWLCAEDNGIFPEIKGWEDMPLSRQDVSVIGVKGTQEGGSQYPPLSFDFSEANGFFPQLQNSTRQINARMLQARRIHRMEDTTYHPGSYDYFSARIVLGDGLQSGGSRRSEQISVKPVVAKVLFVNLPWRIDGMWGVRAGSRWPHIKEPVEGEYLPFPFFMAYAAALLEKNGFDVELIDAIAEGIEEKIFLRMLHNKRPDLLVTETSTVTLEHDLGILKKIDPGIPVALCGADSNIQKEDFLKAHPYITYVLVGEYEHTLLDLVRHMNGSQDLQDVPGLLFRNNGNIVKTAPRPLCNLDDLPWPLRDRLPMHKYFDAPGGIPTPSAQMWASRGCPYQCIFCAWPHIMYGGGTYRTRNTIDVVDEMEYLIKKMNFKSIYFDDDTFNIGRKRMLELCQEIKRRTKEGQMPGVPWAIMARADLMDEELLTEMKSAGLYAVKYGVESAVQEILDSSNKKMDLKKAERMIRLTKAMDMKIHLTFTFGLPGETFETIKKTTDFALRMDPDSVQFSITTPFPGTRYFEELDQKGWIVTKNWADYDGNYKSVHRTEFLESGDLEKAQDNAYAVWEDHCRKRKGITGRRSAFVRFFVYWRSCGFLFAMQKIVKYILFKMRQYKEKQHARTGEDLLYKDLGLRIEYVKRKARIFYKGAELTKDVGLTTSLKILGDWHDSTFAVWSVDKISPKFIRIKSRWQTVPVSQIWHLEITGSRQIQWNVAMEIEEELIVQEEKAGLVVTPEYRQWSFADKDGIFPQLTDQWEEMVLPESDEKCICISGSEKENGAHPPLFFEFSKSGSCIPQLQNATRHMNARFVHARKVWGVGGRTYMPGTYEYFSGTITIGTEPEELQDLGEATRRDVGRGLNSTIYSRRSSFRIVWDSIRKQGMVQTARKILRYFKPRNLSAHYLTLLGIFDGQKAYRGPDFVQIDPTNNCINSCAGCWCHSELLGDRKMGLEEKKKTLPFEVMKNLVDELCALGTKEIYFAGGGEPFMHPRLLDIVEYAKEKKLLCYINTSFVLIDKQKARRLVELGIDHMTVSMWAGDADTYVKTHPTKNKDLFYQIRDVLTFLNSIKNNRRPFIKLYNVISSLNYDAVDAMVDFALQTGSESMEFTLIDTIPGKTDHLLPDSEQTKCLIEQCEDLRRKVHGPLRGMLELIGFEQFVRRIKSAHVTEGEYDKEIINALPRCYIGWTFARVLADGNVNSCLKSHRIPVGSIYRESFRNIWNGPRQCSFRCHALRFDKNDPFFTLIGNDPSIREAGCYKSCDDIIRNINTHNRLMSLTLPELGVLKALAGLSRMAQALHFNKRRTLTKQQAEVEKEWLAG
ncbi:MAG: radical SAM protein [Candidatus Omnitrophica bacterium]|nr:radical SAM protein [Candidatus Omnitrophota bacterium]